MNVATLELHTFRHISPFLVEANRLSTPQAPEPSQTILDQSIH